MLDTGEWDEKCHYASDIIFCMAPWLICCLFVTLLYIERKWLLMRNLATVLPLKSKLSGKFQRFNVVNGSMEMLINSCISIKFKLKWAISKHFKQWAALRKLFSPPPDKSLLRHWNKNFLKEIYSNIQTLAFQVLWKCSSLAFRNGAVQMLFLKPTRNISAGKLVKWVRFFAVLQEYIFRIEWDFLSKTVL